MKGMIFFIFMVVIATAMANSPHSINTTASKRILVVMTNHQDYPTRTDTTGLWLTELTHFTDIVEAAGFTTDFVSPQGGQVPLDERSLGWIYVDDSAKAHLNTLTFRDRLTNTLSITQVDPQDYAAIYYTGGHGVMWDFKDNVHLQQTAQAIYQQGGVISAVCHGVAGLVNLKDKSGEPLIKDKAITGFSNSEEFWAGLKDEVPFFLEDELKKQGANYQTTWLPFLSHAITDGRIVTGQNPSSAKAVAKHLLKVLNTTEQ
ncbi:MAG: type 1 glutamine amidotransferase domain-containing protein [Gammaproteobacteria bacterium]|nr:type 1 glutamine amidotransferase domain-containing protein [Gammaproteobacteria bacterium]